MRFAVKYKLLPSFVDGIIVPTPPVMPVEGLISDDFF